MKKFIVWLVNFKEIEDFNMIEKTKNEIKIKLKEISKFCKNDSNLNIFAKSQITILYSEILQFENTLINFNGKMIDQVFKENKLVLEKIANKINDVLLKFLSDNYAKVAQEITDQQNNSDVAEKNGKEFAMITKEWQKVQTNKTIKYDEFKSFFTKINSLQKNCALAIRKNSFLNYEILYQKINLLVKKLGQATIAKTREEAGKFHLKAMDLEEELEYHLEEKKLMTDHDYEKWLEKFSNIEKFSATF